MLGTSFVQRLFLGAYLPHNAVYLTLTIASVGFWILGIGRSSNDTWKGPLKITDCIFARFMGLFVL